MESLAPIKLGLSERLRDLEFFHEFFDDRTRDEVASQIRELRELRGYTQAAFAREADMFQSAVSRIEQADYSGWRYQTLLKVAKVLRARLKIEFITQEETIDAYRQREAEQNAADIEASVTEAAKVKANAPDRVAVNPLNPANNALTMVAARSGTQQRTSMPLTR